MQPLPTEIVMLAIGGVLLIVQLFLQSISSAFEVGGEYKAGPRDQARVLQSVIAGRADRAFRNLLETFPIFAALALALAVSGRNGGLGALGAEVWVVAHPVCAAVSVSHSVCAQSCVVRLDFRASRDADTAVRVVHVCGECSGEG
jgi:uncharacterized MAPEG superfamily protein